MNTTLAHTGVVPPAAPAAPVTSAAAPDQSAVSWAAIFAGAAAAAALSLALLLLGVGLGLSAVSPWAFEGVSGETFGWSTIAWITFTAIAAYGLGGYLAGRLRTRWVNVHGDETYFRDTAHGFLTWAVASLLTAAVLTSAIGAILGTGAKAAGAVTDAAATTAGGVAAAGVAGSEDDDGNLQYWVDSMLRPSPSPSPAPQPDPEDGPLAGPGMVASSQTVSAPVNAGRANENTAAEIMRIITRGLREDALDPGDSEYIAQRVADRTGMTQADAQMRVSEVESRMRTALDEAETTAREVADEARRATAYAALWLFITLLIGAFSASLLATFGGRQRDNL